jgi:hypothetical protein
MNNTNANQKEIIEEGYTAYLCLVERKRGKEKER